MAMATSQSDCQLVTSVLKRLGGLTEDATTMLAASLPFALGAEGAQKPDQRHGYQNQTLEMIGEALATGSRHADETKEGQVRKIEELRAGVTTCKEKAEEAKLSEAAAQEDFKTKDAAYAELVKEAASVEKEHKEAEVAQKKCDAARDAAEQARDSTMAVRESTLSMLISGEWDKETFEEDVGSVMKLLSNCEVEDCLLAGAAAAFAVKPDARGPFDKVIVDGVQAAVSKKLEELSESAARRVEEATEQQAEALGLWAMLEEAQEAADAAKAEKSQAEKHLKETSKAARDAEKAINTQEEHVLFCEVEQDAQAKKIVDISNAVEALERLKAGDYVVPEPEVPAAPAAMEVDAAAAVETDAAPEAMEVEEAAPAPEQPAVVAPAGEPAVTKVEARPAEAAAVLEAAPSMGA